MGIVNSFKTVFFNSANKEEENKELNKKELKASDFIHQFNNENDNYKSESVTTYYTCLKILSESIGKLSIHLYNKENSRIYNHPVIKLLNSRPNEYMSPPTFKSLLEYNRNHYGDSYVYIKRDKKGVINGLYPLEYNNTKLIIDNKGILGDIKIIYKYKNNNGKEYLIHHRDLLHFKGGLSNNGINGKSVRTVLADTLGGLKASDNFLKKYYKKGLTQKSYLSYTADLNDKEEKRLLERMQRFLNLENVDFVPLPQSVSLKPFSANLSESQFLQIRQYTSLQIASAMGIKPNQLNDYSTGGYSSSEMQNLTFYIDTLLYILKIYEEELTFKLLTEKEKEAGYHLKFNVATVLRGDLKAQSESLRTYVGAGIMTINEARTFAGLPKIKGGDVNLINGTYVPIADIGKAYEDKNDNNKKGVEENDKNI